MSKIDDLIAKFCSDGVEYLSLKDICKSITAGGDLPKRYKKGQSKPSKEFPYPIYSNGTQENSLYGFTDDFRIEDTSVTISARGTIGFHCIREPHFTPIVRLLVLIPNTEIVSAKFLNYALAITKIGSFGGGIPQLTIPNVKKLSIPTPPIQIQEEIVKILDKFTQLEAELEAELKARTIQYEYFRNKLLSFEDKDVEWKTLGEVTHYPKKRISYEELNEDNYVGVENLLQNKKGLTKSNFVPTEGNLIEFITDDVLIGNIRPYLKKIWKAKYSGGTNGDVLVIRINEENSKMISSSFLYHLLASDKFFSYNMRFAKGAKMPRGDKDSIMKYSIPVPSLEEQKLIVSKLDQFDALVNDVFVGLPSEIKARRAQYEHYRGRLLTFKPLVHS